MLFWNNFQKKNVCGEIYQEMSLKKWRDGDGLATVYSLYLHLLNLAQWSMGPVWLFPTHYLLLSDKMPGNHGQTEFTIFIRPDSHVVLLATKNLCIFCYKILTMVRIASMLCQNVRFFKTQILEIWLQCCIFSAIFQELSVKLLQCAIVLQFLYVL